VSPDIAEKLLSNEFTPIADALEDGLGEVDGAAEAGGDDEAGDADGVDNGAPVEHAATTKAPIKATVRPFTTG
jgi:hypothetical protein